MSECSYHGNYISLLFFKNKEIKKVSRISQLEKVFILSVSNYVFVFVLFRVPEGRRNVFGTSAVTMLRVALTGRTWTTTTTMTTTSAATHCARASTATRQPTARRPFPVATATTPTVRRTSVATRRSAHPRFSPTRKTNSPTTWTKSWTSTRGRNSSWTCPSSPLCR